LENQASRKGRFSLNIERNERLYRLWKEGKTIRQAAALTGWPEGSIAGYWRKYYRAAKDVRPMILDNPIASESVSAAPTSNKTKPTKEDLVYSYLQKDAVLKELSRDIASLDPLKKVQLAQELTKMGVVPTAEEIKAYSEFWLSSLKEYSKNMKRETEHSNSTNASPSVVPDQGSNNVDSFEMIGDYVAMDLSLTREFLRNAQWKTYLSLEFLYPGETPHVAYEILLMYKKNNTFFRDGQYEYYLNALGGVGRQRVSQHDSSC
jgi:hypothetical protein